MSWKNLALGVVWSLAIACWMGLFALKLFDPSLETWTMAVTGAAIATEIAFWVTAAVLGVTILEGRKAAFRFLSRPFGR